MIEPNPYAPPSAPLVDLPVDGIPALELADRGTRLGASVLDGLIFLVPWGLMMWGVYAIYGWRLWDVGSGIDGVIANLELTVAAGVVYIAINGRSLPKSGQSLGKRFAKIRIAKPDGSVPTLFDTFVKRYFLLMLVGDVPIIGSLVGLLNVLMIFRESRMCLHDDFAGTIVVKAP